MPDHGIMKNDIIFMTPPELQFEWIGRGKKSWNYLHVEGEIFNANKALRLTASHYSSQPMMVWLCTNSSRTLNLCYKYLVYNKHSVNSYWLKNLHLCFRERVSCSREKQIITHVQISHIAACSTCPIVTLAYIDTPE